MTTTVTPWEAKGKFDNDAYTRLINEFGVTPIDEQLLLRFEKLIGTKLHHLLRRNLFFAHRDLDKLLDAYERKEKIYIYTGRGPSSNSLHLGHWIPLEFTCWLQQVLNCTVVIQIADDEKFWLKEMSYEEIEKMSVQNIKEILAIGFDVKKTFIFSNRESCRKFNYQKIANELFKVVKINEIKPIFGIDDSKNLGTLIWPIYQTVPVFPQAFVNKSKLANSILDNNSKLDNNSILADNSKLDNNSILVDNNKPTCLVAYAIDQDPYFRLARDLTEKLGCKKPCSIISKFLPSGDGNGKMSSNIKTEGNKTIYLNDSKKTIENKIKKFVFSGGQDTLEKHRELGGNPDIDISIQWLAYLLGDDHELQRIIDSYRKGELLTGELKKITINTVSNLIEKHQSNMNNINEEIVNYVMDDSHFNL